MSDYCPHCNQWIYDPIDDDTYSDEETEMSYDDWDYDAEEMEDPDFVSPLKRKRASANLAISSDDDRPRKKRNIFPVGITNDSMQID